ncbi:MAG: hypothetical protein L3J91_00145, partial [Thermoplasmata archaeon]|nr:hypothetical protein [Thermoplasmata archaeon]
MTFERTSERPSSSRQILSVTLAMLFFAGFAGAGALSVGAGVAHGLGFHPNLVAATVHPLASETCSSSGLCPSQVQSAYSFGSLLKNSTMNGTGQSIVIIDACGDSAIATDVAQFDSVNKLPAISLTVYKPQGTPCSNPTGWGLETALDVEWAHAMAPGAAIHLVEAKSASNANLYGAWNYSLKNHLGLVFSNSWGGSGACTGSPAKLDAQATTAGVTILASAGDGGAWGSGQTLAAQQPADCAGIVAV